MICCFGSGDCNVFVVQRGCSYPDLDLICTCLKFLVCLFSFLFRTTYMVVDVYGSIFLIRKKLGFYIYNYLKNGYNCLRKGCGGFVHPCFFIDILFLDSIK